MATADGLVRYDGHTFRTYNSLNTSGIEFSRLLRVGIDQSGLIWVSSAQGNVSSFDGEHFKARSPEEIPNFSPLNEPYAIAEETGRLGSPKGQRIPFVKDYYLDSLNQHIRIDSTFVRIGEETVLENGEFRGGFQDSENTIWIYTRNAGIYQIQRSMVRNITHIGGLSFQNAYSITETSRGEVWLVAAPVGTVRIRQGKAELVNLPGQINAGLKNSFIFYDSYTSKLYASPWNDGLWKLDEAGDWIRQAWFDDVHQPGAYVAAMHRSRDGLLLIGTSKGDLVVKDDHRRFPLETRTGQRFENIRTIKELEDGSFFLGSHGNGLFHLKPDWSWKHYTREAGISSNLIRDIYAVSADTLWLATEDHGLNRLVFGEDGIISESVRITPSDGLLHHGLHRIISDEYGYLWINTNGGIMRIEEQHLQAFANGTVSNLNFYSLTDTNGLVNREGNGGKGNSGITLHNGLIVFPGQAGLVAINPADFVTMENTGLNQTVIEYISLYDATFDIRQGEESMYLPLGQRDFRIRFTLPHFKTPEGLSFTYQLEGLDNVPRTEKQRHATYTNVPPGNYAFRVAGTHLSGSQSDAVLHLIVPHHFYETKTFYAFVGLAVILIGLTFHKVRTKRLMANEKRMRSLLNLQTCYVIRTNLAGTYTYANPRYAETFGFIHGATSGAELAKMSLSFMHTIVAEDRPKAEQTIQELLKSPSDQVLQAEIRKPLINGGARLHDMGFFCHL